MESCARSGSAMVRPSVMKGGPNDIRHRVVRRGGHRAARRPPVGPRPAAARPAAGGRRRRCPLLHRVRKWHGRGVVGAQESVWDARPAPSMITAPPPMISSATMRELLALDAADPIVRLDQHSLWATVGAGTFPSERLAELMVTFYPSLGGTARYLFSSKVSTLSRDDGQAVYRQLHAALTVPEADTDTGWRQLALAVGALSSQLDDVLAAPPPEVADYVALARGFGHRSAHEGIGAAWVVERQLPALWGRLAEALTTHYEVPESALGYLRYQHALAADVEGRIMGLVDRYLDDPWKTFEARRAAHECVWAWKSICERILEGDANAVAP